MPDDKSGPIILEGEERAAVDKCLTYIRSCQRGDGRLVQNGQVPEAQDKTDPYFAGIAALALLAADKLVRTDINATGDLLAVAKYLKWYAQHQKDGYIDKYLDGGNRTEKRDSEDSYAAMLLMVAARYNDVAITLAPIIKAALDKVLPQDILEKLVKDALKALISVTDADGLTFALRDYKIKYTMDNIEVCRGLKEGARLFESLGLANEAKDAAARALKSGKGLASLYDKKTGAFPVGKNEKIKITKAEGARRYPDCLANLFGLACIPLETGAGMKLFNILQVEFKPDDFNDFRAPEAPVERWLMAAYGVGAPPETIKELRALLVREVAAFTPVNSALHISAGAALALLEGNQWLQ